jgi:hypothetical protein
MRIGAQVLRIFTQSKDKADNQGSVDHGFFMYKTF